jgi:putative endonuclease
MPVWVRLSPPPPRFAFQATRGKPHKNNGLRSRQHRPPSRFEKRARRSSQERSGANRIMHLVYLLRSTSSPQQTYIGSTSDLQRWITAHDNGQSPHASKYKPWESISCIAFNDQTKALSFEGITISVETVDLSQDSGRSFRMGGGSQTRHPCGKQAPHHHLLPAK